MCLRRLWCRHEFYITTEYKADTDDTVGYNWETVVDMYCPKCRKKKIKVPKYKGLSILEKQRIDKEYKNERNKYK